MKKPLLKVSDHKILAEWASLASMLLTTEDRICATVKNVLYHLDTLRMNRLVIWKTLDKSKRSVCCDTFTSPEKGIDVCWLCDNPCSVYQSKNLTKHHNEPTT